MKRERTAPKLIIPAIAIAIALLFSACGKQKFEKQNITATATAAQYTKPKIDILFVQDNSASMITPMQYIRSQLNDFLNGIDSNWDFHFTVVPLQSTMPITSKWVIAQDCNSISASHRPYCLTLAQKDYFNSTSTDAGWINSIDYATTNIDLGFQNMQSNLSDASMLSTNFLRADAALAVVVMSNGEDVTGVNSYTCPPSGCDGSSYPDFNSASAIAAFNDFKTFLETSVKATPGMTRFYSVVSAQKTNSCWGSPAWKGLRYMNMSSIATGGIDGASYDICNGNALSNVLANISNQLQSLIQAYIFGYVVLDHEPVLSSVVLKKNGVVIPQSASNGWTYDGYKSDFPIVEFPTPSNNRTGYFLKLNGTAKYSGQDVITIDYQQK